MDTKHAFKMAVTQLPIGYKKQRERDGFVAGCLLCFSVVHNLQSLGTLRAMCSNLQLQLMMWGRKASSDSNLCSHHRCHNDVGLTRCRILSRLKWSDHVPNFEDVPLAQEAEWTWNCFLGEVLTYLEVLPCPSTQTGLGRFLRVPSRTSISLLRESLSVVCGSDLSH